MYLASELPESLEVFAEASEKNGLAFGSLRLPERFVPRSRRWPRLNQF